MEIRVQFAQIIRSLTRGGICEMRPRFRIFVIPAVVTAVVWILVEVIPSGAPQWWLLAAVLLWPFVYNPFAVRPHMSRPIASPVELFDPAKHAVPAWAHAFLHNTAMVLSSQGFTVQNALVGGQRSTGGTWIAVLESPSSGDVALVMTSWTTLGLGSSETSVGFRSLLADGTDFVTTNYSKPTFADPPRPGRTILRASEIRDAIALYRAHRALCATAAAPKVTLTCNGDPVAFQRAEALANHEHLVASGRYFRDERLGLYRATWSTAIKHAWRNTFPVRLVSRALVRRQANAMLRRLGVDAR
jgi:hypothetical protein